MLFENSIVCQCTFLCGCVCCVCAGWCMRFACDLFWWVVFFLVGWLPALFFLNIQIFMAACFWWLCAGCLFLLGFGFLCIADFFGFVGEFDPGSGRTLAACLTHASRTVKLELALVDQWRTGE